ncbi:MAG: thioredoxin fold domain-containing protein [Ferruginibacter sp.]
MKQRYKINFLFCLFLLFTMGTVVSAQQSIPFIKGSYKEALERSRIENKPIFFMCYASWCPHCNKMKKEVFTDSTVAAFYGQHFICAWQDMEEGEGKELHNKFKIRSYPTFIFLDTSGAVLYRTTGEFKAREFVIEGANALTPVKRLSYIKAQFDQDTSNADKCFDLLKYLKRADLDYTDVVKKYFSTQHESDLLSEKNWKIIAIGTTDINSREFQFVLNHQTAFAAITSTERVERKIFFLVKDLLTPFVEEKDTSDYFIYRQPAAAIHLDKIDSLIFFCDIKLYENTKNWEAYKKETLRSVEKYIFNDYNLLKDISGIYLDHITDNAALTQAIKWTDRSLVLNEEYKTYLLDAKLHKKADDQQGAVQMAGKAKEMAVKYGWDHTETDSLLKELE